MRWVAALLLLSMAGCRSPSCAGRSRATKAAPRTETDGEATPDPTTLVWVHSFTGRTARVGGEIAQMLGARMIRSSQGFGTPRDGHETVEQSSATISIDGVRRLFLGFPIWGGEPAPPAFEIVSRLDLHGVEVVPFYTYLHHVDAAALERLASKIRERGGSAAAPIAVHAPLSLTELDLVQRANQALLSRRDAWARDLSPSTESCRPGPMPHAGALCAVPAGDVWIGDTGGAAYLPPRRRRVAAFEIDRTEVTVAQYRRCEKAGKCPQIRFDDSFCAQLVAASDAVPVPCASLDAARAYCAWATLRLPTEAEWMRAGRADDVTPFPWGAIAPEADTTISRGNFGEKPSTGFADYALVSESSAWPNDGAKGLAFPCSHPAGNSRFGVCDLAGNIAEWVTNEHDAPLLKGGSWLDASSSALRLSARARMSLDDPGAGMGFYLTGFRCVR